MRVQGRVVAAFLGCIAGFVGMVQAEDTVSVPVKQFMCGEHTTSALSPDGTYLATGNGLLRLWNVTTGDLVKTFSALGGISSIAFSPDGKKIVAGSAKGTAKLWDIQSENCIMTFSGHSDRIHSVAYSPDGQCILTGSKDKTAKLWDIETGNVAHTFSMSDEVTVVAFSLDGKNILTGSRWNSAELRDISTGSVLQRFSHGSGTVTGDFLWVMAISPDGKSLLTADDFGRVKQWDVTTGKCMKEIAIRDKHNSSWMISLAFSPDGKTFITGSWDRTVRLWDTPTGNCIKSFYLPNRELTSASFSPDGKNILSVSGDGTALLWDIQGDVSSTPTQTTIAKPLGHRLALRSTRRAITITTSTIALPKEATRTLSVFKPNGAIVAAFSPPTLASGTVLTFSRPLATGTYVFRLASQKKILALGIVEVSSR